MLRQPQQWLRATPMLRGPVSCSCSSGSSSSSGGGGGGGGSASSASSGINRTRQRSPPLRHLYQNQSFPTSPWRHTVTPTTVSNRSFTSATSPLLQQRNDGAPSNSHRTKPAITDSRPFAKRYPPPSKSPEPVTFDQPAVSNPLETQKAHDRFRSYSRIGGVGAVAALLLGLGLWFGLPLIHADDAKELMAMPELKGLTVSKEEMESKVQQAQKDLDNTGSFTLLAIKRSTVIAKAVGLCVYDYRKTLNAKYDSTADSNEALRKCHLRSAHRILVALQANGGLYIKLGQHVSSVILLPVEWTSTLKPLQDQNHATPLHELEAMFRSETGSSFADYFSEIDEKPLGVASLAQVHKARDRKTGQWLAIKLMHPEVERFSEVDMKTVNYLVRWVKKVFPQFEFTWLAEEMNQNMPLEMDFRHEAENSRRAAHDFERYRKTSVYIPKVPWVYKRAMAMEFIDGRRPDDLQYLADNNIDRNLVSQELSRVFAQMLYIHGFFHADPHGGNVLIRRRPASGSRSPHNFEVVLLDHGLYFDIEKGLRTDYARFWLSLLSRSTPAVQADRRRLAKKIANIGDDLYPILESAITGRSGLEGSDSKNPHGVKGKKRASSMLDLQTGSEMSEEEQEHIRKTVMEREGLFLSILELLRSVPRRMLMVLKLNDLTRALDASLHTTHGPARPFIIAARYCALAVWDDDKAQLRERRRKNGWSIDIAREWLHCWTNYLWFYRGLAFLETLSNLRAGTSKALAFSSALITGQGWHSATHKVSGMEDQIKRRERERREQETARMSVEGEKEDK